MTQSNSESLNKYPERIQCNPLNTDHFIIGRENKISMLFVFYKNVPKMES